MRPAHGLPALATLLLTAVLVACQPQTSPGSSMSPAPGGGATTGTPEAPPSIDPSAWMVYRSEPGGFALEIPAGWVVQEAIEMGSVRVTFGPPGGSEGVVVQVPGSDHGPSDLPNVRCQEIVVGGLPAVRCRDTVSGGDVTTVDAPGRTYDITSLSKRPGATYEHILDSLVFLLAT